MPITDLDKLDKKSYNRFMKAFMDEMKASEVLPSFRVEYEEVGYWHGLWLKLTKQKPPIKPYKMPAMTGDTIKIKRPKPYKSIEE